MLPHEKKTTKSECYHNTPETKLQHVLKFLHPLYHVPLLYREKHYVPPPSCLEKREKVNEKILEIQRGVFCKWKIPWNDSPFSFTDCFITLWWRNFSENVKFRRQLGGKPPTPSVCSRVRRATPSRGVCRKEGGAASRCDSQVRVIAESEKKKPKKVEVWKNKIK